MRFVNAARFFNNDTVRDGYTGVELFKGQFATYKSAQSDGTFSSRRTLSLDPNLPEPPRGVILVGNQRWVTGEPDVDFLQGVAVRQTLRCKKVTDYFKVLTPGQAALRVQVGVPQAYGYTEFLKQTVDSVTTAAYTPQYLVTLARTERPLYGSLLKSDDQLLCVRSLYSAPDGFWVLTADEVATFLGGAWYQGTDYQAEAEVSAVFPTMGGYDPITDSYSPTTITTTGLMFPRTSLYNFKTEADPRNLSGDNTLLVAKSAVTPKAGDSVDLPDSWRVISVTPLQDAWELHIRRQ